MRKTWTVGLVVVGLIAACASGGTSSTGDDKSGDDRSVGDDGTTGQAGHKTQPVSDDSSGDDGSVAGHSSGAAGSMTEPSCTGCPGCCAGTTCVAISEEDSTTCGIGGVSCSACASGFKCAAGACVVDSSVCSPSSCDGCCEKGACIHPATQNWKACGGGGVACGTCATGIACTNNACDPAHFASSAIFDLQVLSVANCSCTDAVGEPDPYVNVADGSSTSATNECDDVVGCTFTTGGLIHNVAATDLATGKVVLTVYDADEVGADLCSTIAIKFSSPIPATVVSYTATGLTGDAVTFKLTAK